MFLIFLFIALISFEVVTSGKYAARANQKVAAGIQKIRFRK